MSVKYEDVMTKCPYYLSATKYSINCEGLIEGSQSTTKFANERQKQSFQEQECFRYPNKCPLAIEHDRRAEQGM